MSIPVFASGCDKNSCAFRAFRVFGWRV
uniref:Uncharacterized protein n=1 Tax=Anguilla anguilla TaxID=7936 RepID=A0A0E9Y1H3_ANGAN